LAARITLLENREKEKQVRCDTYLLYTFELVVLAGQNSQYGNMFKQRPFARVVAHHAKGAKQNNFFKA